MNVCQNPDFRGYWTGLLPQCCFREMAEDTEIDLAIETLTGTIYELRISIFETILGIKARIQRLEGLFIRAHT